MEILEAIAVGLNLIYLVLLIKERISCWFFGIAASLLSIFLFYDAQLYSEAILYVFYVGVGIYGFRLWNQIEDQEAIKIRKIRASLHIAIILGGTLLALLLGLFFEKNTDAANPYLDAFTTIFSLIASILEAKKIISSWIFWIFINAATVILYIQQDLKYYLFLTLVYCVFSIIGYVKWRKLYQSA